ncbi:MAG TPA: hypothetical protein VHP37_25640 [Burkholderiales bacterium]|nr:hypothetical protein [Burkholderiales bacterium]
MASVIEELEAKIRSLNTGEKAELLRSLIAELDGPPRSGRRGRMDRRGEKRYREIVDGTAETIPADRVFDKIRSTSSQSHTNDFGPPIGRSGLFVSRNA